jgi:hypothetical protein
MISDAILDVVTQVFMVNVDSFCFWNLFYGSEKYFDVNWHNFLAVNKYLKSTLICQALKINPSRPLQMMA